jgi:probable HAF family extracellular repeat protein
MDDESIRDLFSARLGGLGAGNGNFTTGQAYTIDKVLPDTVITAGPAAFTTSSSASFTFTGTDNLTGSANLTYEYSLDGGPWLGATSPLTLSGLAQGAHTLLVRAIDEAGNRDIAAASHSWTVDATAPNTTLTAMPPALSASSSATFSFTGTDNLTAAASLVFQVSLDGGAWTAAISPKNYTGLANGSHTLQVRALDQAGNIDATPASYTWTVNTTVPVDTTITAKPVLFSPSTSASFSFTSNVGGATFQVSLDGSAWTAAASPKTNTGLANGSHTFQVRAVDSAGTPDATPATYTWTVDATAPDTALGTKPPPAGSSTSATFSFSGTDNITAAGTLTFQVSLDGGAWTTATTPKTYTGLTEGSHNLRVRAVDQAGNVDASPASYSWTVTNRLTGYAVTDLGTLGGTTSYAQGINAAGQVVGYSLTASGQYHAFLYSAGTMRDLGTLGGTFSYAMGINANGDVVGYSATASGQYHAFLYTAGTMRDLGTLGGASSYAYDVNDSGQVVGYSVNAAGQTRAFLYSGGTMSALGTLGGTFSYAMAINNAGQITGYSANAAGQYRAFLYSAGAMTDLGTLPGGTTSIGYDINASGQVVGYSTITGGQYHAVRFAGGVKTDLGTLPGGTYSYAYGVNNTGDVVGYATNATGASQPFLSSGGFRYDLATLLPASAGWTVTSVYDLNDRGQIAAYGRNTAGQNHALLLTPNSASFQRVDSTTQGTWKGTYGTSGYSIFQERTSLPSYASVLISGASNYTWAGSTTDVRALQKGTAGASDRLAATHYSASSFTIQVGIKDGASHQLAVYALDWDGANSRRQQIDVIDPVTGRVLNSQTVAAFSGGQYLVWNISGNVQLRVTNLVTGKNAVLSGLFFDS